MKKLFFSLIAVLAIAISANAANYRVDDSAIDALIEASVEVSPLELMPEAAVPAAASLASGSPSPVASFLLCTFLGGFGVHRHYMGTRPWMWAIYVFTGFGIFGIVPLVDWVMLLIGLVDDNIGQYCGNTRFIMWA
ncbi:MAG: TM2 domain-containing protein [Bacteroidales bacterium]|nr:TM2 domain-containing protein [Bacteroidales bacterium]